MIHSRIHFRAYPKSFIESVNETNFVLLDFCVLVYLQKEQIRKDKKRRHRQLIDNKNDYE